MKTHILFVLDKSGSMSSRRDATISGFNEYLKSIKEDDNLKNAKLSLTLFDTEINEVVVSMPLQDIKELTSDTYAPDGMTALYDAVGHVLSVTKDDIKKKHRALVVIMTDGEENSSREYTRQKIFDMIKHYEEKGNYTFVFLGCDQDVWLEGGNVGVVKGNIAAYDGSNIKEAFGRLSVGTRSYAGGQSASISNFWEESQ